MGTSLHRGRSDLVSDGTITDEFVGKPCPVCLDDMRNDHDNFLPTWSDEYDNIVCWTCAVGVASR